MTGQFDERMRLESQVRDLWLNPAAPPTIDALMAVMLERLALECEAAAGEWLALTTEYNCDCGRLIAQRLEARAAEWRRLAEPSMKGVQTS